ncbi:uncharacterized protein LOC130800969 [Amaranthus tricolor]|uniref:uncharacterized protein LOC130800969 n=1 Tax=Amaranthus tricolor TaxID=29722 RepID=UPI002582BB29|nr:uncharacterized protein LOC130800969 [Amaranthus tricolor]
MGSLKGYDIDSKDALLEAVRVYHIHSNVEYRIETSNQTSLSLKCKKGCSWKLRARLNPYSTSWFISKYNGKHENCVLGSDTVSAGHIHLTSSGFINVIRNCVSKDPLIKVSVVRQMVKDRFGIEVTYKLAWCTKQQALLSIYGTREDSYSLLPRFLKAPSIEGLKFCKPLIAIEGKHLYGYYCHTLLTAIAQDVDKGIFLLAFSLVEKECITAWSWFKACIHKHVTQKMGLCIISDRYAGILATMEETKWQPPYAHHRLCLRHLLSNFNRAMGNVQLKKLFGRTVEQRQHVKVVEGLRAIRVAKREALFWIDEVGDMSMWSLCHDGDHRV